MPEIPKFFVPTAETPEQAESFYAQMAAMPDVSVEVPSKAQRIYSITFKPKGEKWTATVGEELKGTKYRSTGSGRNKREIATPTFDPATVLAIFPGNTYLVVTTQAILDVRSQWEGVFKAGLPKTVTYFAPDEE